MIPGRQPSTALNPVTAPRVSAGPRAGYTEMPRRSRTVATPRIHNVGGVGRQGLHPAPRARPRLDLHLGLVKLCHAGKRLALTWTRYQLGFGGLWAGETCPAHLQPSQGYGQVITLEQGFTLKNFQTYRTGETTVQ